jgi:primosomal protein N' (replication factor Y) (superfamily II helicase)
MAKRVVDVLVPVALDRAYSYRVPETLSLAWADNPKPNPRLDNRLKDVEEKLDLAPLKDDSSRPSRSTTRGLAASFSAAAI